MKSIRLGGICANFNCAKCCKNTEMLLSSEDIARIESLGYERKDFCDFTIEGFRILKNVKGECFFLKDNRCTIYQDRPQGCCFYPIIFDLDLNRTVLDKECPLIDTIHQNVIRNFEKYIKKFIMKIIKEKKIYEE